MTIENREELIGSKEAAKILGVSQDWVQKLARAGKIPAKKPYDGAREWKFYRSKLVGLGVGK